MRIFGASKNAPGYPCPPGFNGSLAGLYRYFSGRPLNGHRYTDATFLHAGTMATDLSGHATTYQLWPGWKRVAIVRLPLLAVWPLGIVAMARPLVAIWLVAMAVTLAVPGLVAMAKERGHRREVIEPVAMAVAKVLNRRHVRGHGHQWVAIPRGHRDIEDGVVATVAIPASWPGDKGEMARVAKAVTAKLSDPDLVATWELAGRAPYVEFHRPPKPPTLVTLEQARHWTCAADELILGQGVGGKPKVFSLALESPHMMIAGGSGAGKSEFLAHLIGQLMRRGYGVAVLDSKFISHRWLRAIPGVLYASEREELHEALIWLDSELLRRSRFVSSGGDESTLIPMVVVMEEMNSATDALRGLWQEIKPPGVTGMSPALRALRGLASKGRELRMHILTAGQSLTSNAMGGPEARESFAGRALSRATRAQWKMLAPQIKQPPMKNGALGHWHVVVGDEIWEFQAPFCDLKNKTSPASVAELTAWALGGEPLPDVPAMMLSLSPAPSASGNTASEAGTGTAGIVLSEYVDSRPGLKLETVKKWRTRFPDDFPDALGETSAGAKLYDEAELDRFVWSRVG